MKRLPAIHTLLLILGSAALAAPTVLWSTPKPLTLGAPSRVDWQRSIYYGIQLYQQPQTPTSELRLLPRVQMSMFDLRNGQPLKTFALPGKTPVFAPWDSAFPTTLSPDGTRLAIGYTDRTPPTGWQLLEASTGRTLVAVPGARRVGWLEFHPTREEVLVGSDKSCPVQVFHAKTGKPITDCLLKGVVNDVWEMGFTPSGQLWVVRSNGDPSIFSYPGMKRVLTLKPRNIIAGGLSFSPDGKLVTGCFDNLNNFTSPTLADAATFKGAEVFDAVTGRLKYELPGKVNMCVRFSPDRQHMISQSVDGVKLWDVKTGKLVRRVPELGEDCLEEWNRSRASADYSKGTRGSFAPWLSPDGTRALDSVVSCDGEVQEVRLVRLK
jgi:WD40 repeat protein